MTKTRYSISAASRVTGLSRATIARHAKAGKLSFELDRDGNKEFDASELVRVYGDDCDFEREASRRNTNESPRSVAKSAASSSAVDAVREEQIKQYQAQVEHLQRALDKAQETGDRITLLLEDRSRAKGDWQASLDAMAKSIAEQTEKQLQQLRDGHNKEILQLKRALHHERNKTLWQRLTGRGGGKRG